MAISIGRALVADSHKALGELLLNAGKSSEAEAEDRKALSIRQKLADDNPAVTEFRSNLAWGHRNLGILLSGTGKPAEAEAENRQSLAIYQWKGFPVAGLFQDGLRHGGIPERTLRGSRRRFDRSDE